MRVIDYLKEMFPPALRLFVQFTDQRVLLNQSITTRIPGAAAAYDASSGYTSQDVTDTDKSVTVSNFYATSIKFTVAEMSKTNRDLVEEHAAAAANNLGAQLMDHLFGTILAAAFSNTFVEAVANWDDDTLRNARKRFANRKVPPFGRIGICNADAYEALTGDSVVLTADTNPQAREMFEFGPTRHRQRGFDMFEYAQLPTNSENLCGVFMAPGALIGAVGIPADANEDGFWDDAPKNALVRPQTDPDTGITLLERRTRNADGSAQLDLAWIYGFAAGDPARLDRVTTV